MHRAPSMLMLVPLILMAALGFSGMHVQGQAGPDVAFISPTGQNGTEPVNRTYVTWNVSSSQDIASCTIEINGTNQTGTAFNASSGSYCYYNETGLPGNVTRCSLAHVSNASGAWATSPDIVCRTTNEQQTPGPSDTAPPDVSFVSPTPGNNTLTQNLSWVFLNASSSEPLSSCLLDDRASNASMTVSGNYCYLNLTGQANGTGVYVRVWAEDASGNLGLSPDLNVTISLSGTTAQTLPSIDSYTIYPPVLFPGDDVLIGINASDDGPIGGAWANITYPNGTYVDDIPLQNDQLTPWNASLSGTYNVTLFAEDSSNNLVNATISFTVGIPFYLGINISDADDQGVSAYLDVYSSGTAYNVFSDSDQDGEFNISLVDHEYDILVLAFDDEFEMFLREVDIDQDFDGYLYLDRPDTTDGFEYIFAVETDYDIDDADIAIYYDGMAFSDTDSLEVHVCEDWDFPGQYCDDDWDVLDDITNNEDDEYLEFTVDGFSAFAISEESYCGDDQCDSGETTSNCPEDCACDDGDTRDCDVAHSGRCASGTEACQDNEWSGCPSPVSETCNGIDDDCDGTIDDVNGGSSPYTTKCQCYGGSSPVSETCNGIDDDCDSIIDNGADCCTDGQTRQCGPATEEGECQRGTIECSGGTWSTECLGAVYPENEVCGDNKDNDCDGEVDEACQLSTCDDGIISSSCLCGDTPVSSGYCCSGTYSTEECAGGLWWWWIPVVAGVAILVVLVFLIMHFRSQGRELTWEELMNKYGRSGQPAQET